MAVLSDLRTELAGMLSGTGVNVYDHLPERMEFPAVIVLPGDPYVSEVFDAKTFDYDYRIRVELLLVSDYGTNESQTDAVDELIENVLVALQGAWTCEVGAPGEFIFDQATYLTAKVDITTDIQIN